MKITKLPNGKWNASYYIGSKQYRIRGDNKKDLETEVIKQINEYKQQHLTPEAYKNTITFEQACEKYMSQYAIPNNQSQDKYHIPYYIKFFGEKTKIGNITLDKIKDLRTQMLQVMPPSTFLRRWSLLHSIFRESANSGFIPGNLLKKVSNKAIRKMKGARNRRIRWFTPEEMTRIYKTLLEPMPRKKHSSNYMTAEMREENMLYAVIARNTGFRENNLTEMTWDRHVHFNTNKVQATETKNGLDYSVPMTPTCRKALLRLWELKGKPTQGRVFRKAVWTRIFTQLFRRLGWNTPEMPKIERAVLHSFRHTFCSHLVMKGYNERTIMAMMGWKNSTELRTYAHLSPNYEQTAINTIDSDFTTEGDKLLTEALQK